MRKLVAGFFRENGRGICLYIGAAGIFYVIFVLYNIRTDAVRYAFLLAAVWSLLYAGMEFARYFLRHKRLLEAEHKILAGEMKLPEPLNTVEEDYQRMIEKLCEERGELESEVRISRQEMLDYYSMWAHQIKTPMAALGVLIQTVEENSQEKGWEENRELVKNMKLELFKTEQYVEMVLGYLRMEDMSSDLAFSEYSLDDMIRQAVRKYSQMFIFRKIRLNYEPTGTSVLTDDKWFVFVLEQILSNSLKYTKSGSISIYIEGDSLVIEDTGIGIQKEDIPRVFERGFTGYNGRSHKKSTGIGLYLSKSIMDKLGHEIRLESEVGEGTKVYLGIRREKLSVE